MVAPSPRQSTPLLAKLTNSAFLDAVVLNEAGLILFRRGLSAGTFAPLSSQSRPRIWPHAISRSWRPPAVRLLAAPDAQTFAVTLYQPNTDGTFTILAGIPSTAFPRLPARQHIASGVFTAGGLGDSVISAAASDHILVVFQTAPGVFDTVVALRNVGVNPSGVAIVDVNGDAYSRHRRPISFAGQVSVLPNRGQRSAGRTFPRGRAPLPRWRWLVVA